MVIAPLFWLTPLIFLISVTPVVAEESLTPFEYTQQIKMQLDQLKELPPKSYLDEIEEYRKRIERYIQHKKGVCNGEFSVFILSEQKVTSGSENGREQDARLSEHERLLCFRELKALHVTFVNNSFVARRSFIKYQHKELLAGLEKVRGEIIDGIHKNYSDQNLKKKKRSRSRKKRRRGSRKRPLKK
jgi:hypothetical protein